MLTFGRVIQIANVENVMQRRPANGGCEIPKNQDYPLCAGLPQTPKEDERSLVKDMNSVSSTFLNMVAFGEAIILKGLTIIVNAIGSSNNKR